MEEMRYETVLKWLKKDLDIEADYVQAFLIAALLIR